MSKLIINEDNTKGKIEGVVFCYAKLQDGSFKYQSKTEKEYVVDCVVDKTTAKAFKKAFPKNGYKEVETSEFEEIFKIPPVYPEEDEQYIIKLKANANLKADVPKAGLVAGDIVPYEWANRTKAFVPVEGGVKDITMEVLVGNGSKGVAAFNINENSFGVFPQLTGILVTDLIEYEQKGMQSAFGNVVGGLNPGNGNFKQVATENSSEKDVRNEEGGSEPDPNFDDSKIPF